MAQQGHFSTLWIRTKVGFDLDNKVIYSRTALGLKYFFEKSVLFYKAKPNEPTPILEPLINFF